MTENVISIIALFDDEGTESVRNIQRIIEPNPSGLNDLPHLTLAVYDKPVNEDELIQWVMAVAEDNKAFHIDLCAVGVFHRSCIFAVPRLAKRLKNLYLKVHEKFEEQCREYLKPSNDKWFPHVGLLYTDVENACEKMPVLMEEFQETRVKINSLRITLMEEQGFRVLFETPLRNI